GHDHRGGYHDAAFGKSRQTLIEHVLGQGELVVAAPPRAYRIGATDGKVDWDNEFAIADDDQEEDAIDTGHGAFALATIPGTDEAELFAVFAEDRIINDPSPLP